ncbi:ABC-2 type transporter-domain-containing protein [Phascolomyces articulosus]|uniref:ABC-2 type transporter-domain-containing protein n=1 Tax=Phascolomyces articulosus TaxID=60185 RepID=A0AAD5PEW9_9FUNG|nr:ABC-2 type transporter-domain-containing protein [Phascolomyces articulosus]KAI9265135.1 ABC-2 type transporter-domain-containing protein [Phascolomyces articulosus]
MVNAQQQHNNNNSNDSLDRPPSDVTVTHNNQYGSGEAYGEINANTVDVEAAIEEYHEMKRELSRISRHSNVNQDLEKAGEEGRVAEEEFDLDQFLQGLSYEDKEAGKKPKHLGLVWKDLEVEGIGADAHTIPTVITGLLSLVQPWKLFNFGFSQLASKKILHPLSGFVKEGEMLLVLGRPGAGTTTLLKVLANMRGGYTNIKGDVSYGGIDPETFAKHYRGQVIYNEEEDQHYPTLTTKETLQFALRTKTPGNRLPDETKKVFVNKLIYMLGNMLGLSKKMDTLVGDASVRGLSGGERKRLSIAEAMTTQSSINLWDGSTRGLDAVTALDYVRSLRIMTDVLHKTTVSTLYQASNSMFALYDKILLLDSGYMIYFGPVEQAKSYFENLGYYASPRKSIPDFLTGISNPLEREVKEGYTVPESAAELHQRYLESDVYKKMMYELDEYQDQVQNEKPADLFKAAVFDEHQKRAPKKDPYTVSFYQQVKALAIRNFQLLARSHSSLLSRYGTVLIIAFMLGSCFYKMPLTANGAVSRAGAICFTVIINGFISHSDLVNIMVGRPILEKHKHYAMYRPSAYYISQIIMDFPLAIAQVLLWEIITYFLMGLNLDAGRFFTHFLTLVTMSVSMSGFFRFFGLLTNNFMIANLVACVMFIYAFLYMGYYMYYSVMHPWFFWIHWIYPLAYAYKALLITEMQGQVYTCDGPGSSIPYGPGYDDWAHKICSMNGGTAGESFVLGDDYLRDLLGIEPNWLWSVNIVMLIVWFLFFTGINMLLIEKYQLGSGGSLTKLYLPGKAPKPRTPEEEKERLERQLQITEKMDQVSTGTTFSWQHINYTVPVKGGSFQILNDVSGIVKPGHLTALMGSSGAGKTTLLDVLARRKTIGKVEGRTYLNSEMLLDDFERITGYVEQMDVHQPADTVREAMQFSAYLRQDASVPKSEKDAYVEQIIQLLEMEDIADAQVGDLASGCGISVEERKRLTIAMELVAKPKLIFLDEPTSGLDAQSSYNIVRFLRKLADAGWPVVCTIHQPSAILFEYFDHLHLLVRGGRTAYYGKIGQGSKIMIEYFETNGGPRYAPDSNPAEYILDVVASGNSNGNASAKNWADVWANSPNAKALDEELEAIHNNVNMNPTRKSLTYATPFLTQLYFVFKRMSLVYWRSSGYNLGRFLTIASISLFIGFTFWKLSLSFIDIQNRILLLFGSMPLAYMMITMGQPKFMGERVFFRREYASRFYGWVPYAMSAIIVEIPYILFLCFLFMIGIYYTVGLADTSEAAGYYYLMTVLFVVWAVTMGFILGGLTENPYIAAVLTPLAFSSVVTFAGVLQTQFALPRFWSAWMYWLVPFHYVIEGLVVNELENLPVIPSAKDLFKFTPPAGLTCGEYLKEYFASGATGFLIDPNSTTECSYSLYSSGKELYTTFYGWDAAHKWQNIGIVCIYCVFNVLVCAGLIYWRRKARR